MQKYLIIFFYFFVFEDTGLRAQISLHEKEARALIGRAELSIINGDFKEAINLYDNAQNLNSLEDNTKLNRIICYLKVGRDSLAVIEAKNILENGFPISYFKKTSFKKLFYNKKWLDFSSEYIAPSPSNLKIRIESLLNEDQRIRQQEVTRDSFILIQNNLVDSVRFLIKENGYIDSKEEGYNVYNDTILLSNGFTYLLIHALQVYPLEFRTILDSLLNVGDIKVPNYFFYSRYFMPQNRVKCGCESRLDAIFIQIENKLYTCGARLEFESNVNREKFGLLPIGETIKLINYYYFQDKSFKFDNVINTKVVLNSGFEKDHIQQIDEGLILYKTLEKNDSYFK